MTVVRSVSDVLSDHVRFEIACIDRMYLTAPPQRAMRRVAANGTVTVAGQRLRVRRSYEGRTVAITIEDTVFRVLLNGAELSTHAGESPTATSPSSRRIPPRKPLTTPGAEHLPNPSKMSWSRTVKHLLKPHTDTVQNDKVPHTRDLVEIDRRFRSIFTASRHPWVVVGRPRGAWRTRTTTSPAVAAAAGAPVCIACPRSAMHVHAAPSRSTLKGLGREDFQRIAT